MAENFDNELDGGGAVRPAVIDAPRPGHAPVSGVYDGPPLPPVVQPTGWKYYLGTWSGRILVVNFIVFVLICIYSRSIFMPDQETLIKFGVKDPVGLAHGEFWRLLTPMFIHIGIIHFALNSLMLYVVGYQLERLVGGAWYVVIYLLSGIAGNISSAAFSLHMSAGASGAIFGLLGCGFYLEHTVGNRIKQVTGKKPRNRVYAMTVILNLGFGLIVPFIDNSAHIGGLVMGTALTFAMMNLRQNRLQKRRRWLGVLVVAMLLAVSALGVKFGTSKSYLTRRAEKAGDAEDDSGDKLFYYSQAVDMSPDDPGLRLKRARILLLEDETKYALFDLRIVLEHPAFQPQVQQLADELQKAGKVSESWQVRRLLEHSQ